VDEVSQGREWYRFNTHEVRDDRADTISARQWQTALLHDLRRSVFCNMAGRDDNLRIVWIRDQIHGATHALEYLARDHEVGKIAVGTDL
jgi:hypothetical protein